MTGLTLDEADCTMKETLPPIQQFLNRCLALRIDMQDAIFEAFGGFLSAIIEDARQAGTLDVGLETLRAEKFEIVDRKVIFEHEGDGRDGNCADRGAYRSQRSAHSAPRQSHLRRHKRRDAVLEQDLQTRGPDGESAGLHGRGWRADLAGEAPAAHGDRNPRADRVLEVALGRDR